ncbi:MAG TPA: ABC transporter ATP-binding protein [Anaerolineae bacterium]|nr:ABC transporter ATP-binding protein [Anaerolineae bacterium]
MMESLVRLEDIRVYFWIRRSLFRSQAVHAVDGVSLTIGRGETVALVGESGSGKTTLGRASLGLVKPTSGRVLFDGVEITELKGLRLRRFRRRAQAIFQDPYSSVDPFMTAFQSVEEPLLIHGIGSGRERTGLVYQALRDVKLTPEKEMGAKFPHLLSGGQRQRVGIARALVLRPDYIVADEAVSMIDASGRAEILYLLRELQEQYGIAFLYITHDIATARHFAQRIAVMYLGIIVESGPVTAVVEHPLHPYTRALIEAVPEPNPANRTRLRPIMVGEPPSPMNIPTGCSFHPRCLAFMSGMCEVERPELVEVEARHFVACHLYLNGRKPDIRACEAPPASESLEGRE